MDQNYSLNSRMDGRERPANIHNRHLEEDDNSDTFEEYLEKSNMLCSSQDGTEHYFLPNSHKSDFV